MLVYGNCQAHWLAGLLAAQGVGLVCIVAAPFGFYPEAGGVRPFFVTPEEAATLATQAKLAGRQVTLLEQTSPLHPGLDAVTLRLGSHVVRFPHLEVRAYWHPWLTRSGDGFAPDRIRRQFEFDLAAMRRSEAKAGWSTALTDHLAASHKHQPHFYTLNHPGADLMQRLHAGICEGIGARGALDQQMYAWAQTEIDASGGISFISEHPLHDSVLDALELEWARQGSYDLWQRAYFAAGAGHHGQALDLLSAALDDPDHDPHLNYTLGKLLLGLGDPAGAMAAFGKAHRAYPQNPEYARLWLGAHTADDPVGSRLQAELRSRFPG